MEKEKIKAEELRIGNLVLRNGFLFEEKNKFSETVVSHNDITACVVSPESFLPIPLTEEWLIRFGFELEYESSFTKIFSIDGEDYSFRYKYLKIKGIESLEWRGNVIKCKYVHQLQNLYFALTGEELKLTPKE